MHVMEWRDHIERRDDVAFGKPVLKGTRFAVNLVMEQLASGVSFEDVLEQFPHVTREQLVAAHLFAAEVLENIKSDEAMPPKERPKEFWEEEPERWTVINVPPKVAEDGTQVPGVTVYSRPLPAHEAGDRNKETRCDAKASVAGR